MKFGMVGSFVFLFRKMVSFCVYDNINMGVNNMVTPPEEVVELFME